LEKAYENKRMTYVQLSDSEWEKIREFLRADPNVYVGKDKEACHRFVEAVKMVRAQWGAMAVTAKRVWEVEYL
jgi:hypothetical protein